MLSDHPVFPILLSKDLAASRTFYHDKLGLEVMREILIGSSSAVAVGPSW